MTRWRSWLTLSSAGVDDDVGPGPHRLEQPALVGDGLGHLALQDGMAPPGALEAPHEDVLGGVEVDELDPMALGPQRVDGGEGLFDPRPAAAARAPARRGPGSDPGRPTTSATSLSSDGGMLSITYQPASSRAAAAVDRPHPTCR